MIIAATQSDTIGGSTYTFGLLDVSYYYVIFDRQSLYVTKILPVIPSSAYWTFQSNSNDPGLSYFLGFNGSVGSQYYPGDEIEVPGGIRCSWSAMVKELIWRWP